MRATVGPFEIDFRLLTNAEQFRWVSARGQGNGGDIKASKMTGLFLDVTGRKQAEEGHELLAEEMSHRVKNLLALASGLTAMTSRLTEIKEWRANSLSGVQPSAAPMIWFDLYPIARDEQRCLGTYSHCCWHHMTTSAIRIAVLRPGLGEKSADGLALIIHELATNSLKCGPLSTNAGLLDVSGTVAKSVIDIVWSEQRADC